MSERRSYTRISATSNTVVQRGYGVIHGVIGKFESGSVVRIDDTHSFAQGVLNINAASSNTIAHITGPVTDLDIGVNAGIVVAVSSNSLVTIIHQ